MEQPTILFIHAVCPAQFSDLCEYLNTTGLATAFYMTTPGNRERNQDKYQNLLPFSPDGNIVAASTYYYSGKVERAGRISVGLYEQIHELLEHIDVDLIVAHGSMGSPHFLFDEFDIPIITYIEFPSYADHGWDPKYPPTEPQRLTDKNMQMLSYFQVMKGQKTIVPTEYARKMFPPYLQDKIVARFEGMVPEKLLLREECDIHLPQGKQLLGFASRDLSSAKGLESFIATADHLISQGEDIHFVVIGDPTATTYGYERVFLDAKYGKEPAVNFIDHLLLEYELPKERFTFTGKLPYAQFSDLVHRIDLFMYPVLFGSGNWGLLELLARGRPVIAARRCYVDEQIDHDVNGLLVEEDRPHVWAQAIVELLADPQRRSLLGRNAQEMSRAYHLPLVADEYMSLFTQVIKEFEIAQT